MPKINRQGRASAALLAAVLALGVMQFAPVTPAIAAASQADRERVQWRAMSDGRWEVRTAAVVALNSSDPNAVTRFLQTGLTSAINRAVSFERADVAEINYWLRISPTDSAVHLGCERALLATHDEKHDFVETGLAIAQELDASGQHQHEEEVAEQAQADRDFVASLAQSDPGPQVRAAAVAALAGGEDRDIADFFKYYWAAGARLDDEAYRLAISDLDLRGNAALARLRQAALDAEAAEAAASGEAAEKLHAETVAAWRAVATAATGTSVNWAAERDRAAEQAAKWSSVAEYAQGATTEQDWAAVVARAGTNAAAWQDAVRWAEEQAQMWARLAEEADDR
ncbi:hypothetical protein I0C86_26725 [Plantactinospora sp. S1510]|uniref:HEAT repeat domain-containing protein n=1 Tax=Plantactinospora alkalitolerans TaxID=2789879 RepID=A0ABS0H304_9ACTN|nr:hypothetical protein [Plantactinospora alkalitolerans]MBF9132519.1 hypothetical protein [Plantactinospora alkalitolerans]